MGWRRSSLGTGGSRPSGIGLALIGGLALAVVTCACGDKPPRATGPHPPAGDRADTSADADPLASNASKTTDAGLDDPLTDEECRRLVDHVVEIAVTRFRQQAAEQGKPIPTEAQLQEIRAGLQRELGEQCLAMPREDYDCAMRARDAAAIEACAAPPPPVDK